MDHIVEYYPVDDTGRTRADCSCSWTSVRKDEMVLKTVAEAHLAANYSQGKTSLRRRWAA